MNFIRMKNIGVSSKLTVVACAALLTAIPASSQTVADVSVPQTGLNIPEKLTIYGKNDPNVRRANAVVNGDIITGTDVKHRMALLLINSGQEISDEERQRLRLQVLRNLVDETLKIQEAEANEITVTPSEVNSAFALSARDNTYRDATALNQHLRSIGSSPDTLKRQIKSQIAWASLKRRNIHPFTNVADEEVNTVIAKLNASKGTTEYRIGEIYMSAAQETAQQVTVNMRKILEQIRGGGSFVSYARQFSESSTAATGGDLGWVRPAQLPQSLADATVQMQVGQVVGPIEVPGGFSILYLINQRQVLTADPRDALLSLKQLGISFPAGTTETQASSRAAQFALATQKIKGCGAANEAAASIGAAVVDNRQIRLGDLPRPLQSTIAQLSIGQASQPFGSVEEGILVLILCGRDDPPSPSDPSFEKVMSDLENVRIEKRARIYLRDLRRDAIIEYN